MGAAIAAPGLPAATAQGTPKAPQCGFSNMACRILDAYGTHELAIHPGARCIAPKPREPCWPNTRWGAPAYHIAPDRARGHCMTGWFVTVLPGRVGLPAACRAATD